MVKKLETGFKKGYKPEKESDEEEKIEEEEAEEKTEKDESDEDESDEEAKEEEKIKPEPEEETPAPEEKKEKTERIVLKQAVTMDMPKKNSWVAFEAPDKNGKKIVKYFGKAARMKDKLLEQEEIITFIPREQGEHKSVPQIVNLNGYKLNIPKNTYVSLPAQIAEVIRTSHQQVEDAYEEMNRLYGLDRDPNSTHALF